MLSAFILADHLQCHVDEVLALPVYRVRQWFAYLRWAERVRGKK